MVPLLDKLPLGTSEDREPQRVELRTAAFLLRPPPRRPNACLGGSAYTRSRRGRPNAQPHSGRACRPS